MGLECQILLDRANKNYYAGETISGRVVVISDQPQNVKGLKLNFEGKCSVKFSEVKQQRRLNGPSLDHHMSTSMQGHPTHTSEFESVTVHYSSEEKYLDYKLDIFGNVGTDIMFPQGRFEYPFQLLLPYGLPSTYEGSHGKVDYQIHAVLSRSWAFDCKTSTSFRVNGQLDLNVHPQAQEPVFLKEYKNYSWFFSKGDMGFAFKMPKRGLVIGGIVPFVIEIHNKTPKTAKSSVSIIQEVKFFAEGEQRTVKDEIAKVYGPLLPPGGDDVWTGNSLQVPLVPPTKLGGGCHLIDINYILKVKLSSSGIFSDLKTETPVVLGTVPFRPTESIPHDPPPPYQLPLDPEDSDFAVIDPHPAPNRNIIEASTAPSAPALYDFDSKA